MGSIVMSMTIATGALAALLVAMVWVPLEAAEKPGRGDKLVKEPASKVKADAAKGKFRTPVVLDLDGTAAAKYNVRGFPTLIVADHKAQILLRSYYVPFGKLEPILDEAVKKAAADTGDSKPQPASPRINGPRR